MDRTAIELDAAPSLEAYIARREEILADIRDDLLARRPLASWDEAHRDAFLGALADEACPNEPEAYKARTMRAHLFRNLTAMPGRADRVDAFGAETVRADLIRLVPLGAGRYLLRE